MSAVSSVTPQNNLHLATNHFYDSKKTETFRFNSHFIARDLAMIRNDVRSVRDKRNNWLGLLVITACCKSREINQLWQIFFISKNENFLKKLI